MSTLHLQRRPNATDLKFTINDDDKTWTITELFPSWIHVPQPTPPNTPPAEKEEEVSPTSPSHPTNGQDIKNAPSSPSYKPGSPINFYTNPIQFQEKREEDLPTSPTRPSYSPTSPDYSDTTPEPGSPSYPPKTTMYSPMSKPDRDESDGCPCTSCALHASMFGGDADARVDSDEEVVYTGEATPAKRRKIDLAKAMEDGRFIDLTEGGCHNPICLDYN
jgi:hypothetical protein